MSTAATGGPPVSASTAASASTEICLIVEGTYPYVAGGVSSWIHDLIRGLPDQAFSVVNIGSHPSATGEPRYAPPPNLGHLYRLFCQEGTPAPLAGPARAALDREIRAARRRARRFTAPSRVLRAIQRMHLGDGAVRDDLVADLAAGDLDVATFLHGHASFDLLAEVGERLAPDVSFLDLFWHFRAMHVPLLRLLAAPPPPAAAYHAVSTGYAGLLGAVWGRATGRPFVVTEHGIYTRERDMELARAEWIRDRIPDELGPWAPAPSALRRLWSGMFRTLARIAYHGATRIITLSEVNRQKQLADGAPAEKTSVIPNGVDLSVGAAAAAPPAGPPVAPPADAGKGGAGAPPAPSAAAPAAPVASVVGPIPVALHGGVPHRSLRSDAAAVRARGRGRSGSGIIVLPDAARPMRVGFVGRVVPIKDVVTFIRACDLALRRVPLDVRIIGPDDEDPTYAARCKALVRTLGREEIIRFLGPQPLAKIYGELDVVVLTSFSEGQPLVMLEGYAASLPAIATDVGACREMIDGRTAEDRALGPSGVVTRVAIPEDTAAALVRLADDPLLRRRMGAAGRRRVTAHYQRREMLAAYRALYREIGEGT